MKRQRSKWLVALALGALALASLAAQAAATRTITDMAGRTLAVPEKVSSVYSLNPIGTVAVYTLNPAKVAAITAPLSPAERQFLPEAYQRLPVWGQATGGHGNVNLEAILAGHPDIILSAPLDPSQIAISQEIQDKTGIPVIMLDQDIEHLDQLYRLLGSVLGEETRAAELAAYARGTLDWARQLRARVGADQRPTVYYAEGAKGLQTDPAGSFHTQVLDLLGGKNVAQVGQKSEMGLVGMSSVSFEQLATWNPGVIIATDNPLAGGGFFGQLTGDPAWASLGAVKAKRVYRIPAAPWDWFDRPPSVNRLIGVRWLGQVLYPDLAKQDIRKEAKEFYALFYRYQLSEAQLDQLLKGALP
jgi:iron complex transport system substrate-binding protein